MDNLNIIKDSAELRKLITENPELPIVVMEARKQQPQNGAGHTARMYAAELERYLIMRYRGTMNRSMMIRQNSRKIYGTIFPILRTQFPNLKRSSRGAKRIMHSTGTRLL